MHEEQLIGHMPINSGTRQGCIMSLTNYFPKISLKVMRGMVKSEKRNSVGACRDNLTLQATIACCHVEIELKKLGEKQNGFD